ncbi:MAG TPA: hypothetical protein VJ761_14910 [Ktedonobacteraceae bacterium]|nr:hypothetical protein [Ktedonobacteraceae bacterium]
MKPDNKYQRLTWLFILANALLGLAGLVGLLLVFGSKYTQATWLQGLNQPGWIIFGISVALLALLSSTSRGRIGIGIGLAFILLMAIGALILPPQPPEQSPPASTPGFVLSTKSILSDISSLQNDQKIEVRLVDQMGKCYDYNATVKQARDANGTPAAYLNEVAADITITLDDDNKITDFSTRLANASAIYLFSTPTTAASCSSS